VCDAHDADPVASAGADCTGAMRPVRVIVVGVAVVVMRIPAINVVDVAISIIIDT
jgi:hypothetical protein